MKKGTSVKDTRNFLRQLDIFNPAKHGAVAVHIIGAGGIGSFTAIALAKLGLTEITVWDGDNVEAHNLPNQFHSPDQLGVNKAIALSETVFNLTGTRIASAPKFWRTKDAGELEGVVISAVDHMEKTEGNKNAGRRELWKAVKDNVDVDLFVDGRLGGQVLRVLAVRPMAERFILPFIESRMFPQAQAKELPCTARGIIDVGFVMAALITNIVRKYLVNGRLENNEHDIVVDMANLLIAKAAV